jgi:3D (Asp-Asp-Asp) domain-containing protein
MPEVFKITHYTFALEADPAYASSPKVSAKGLTGMYRKGFLFGASGILMQGTGLAEDGRYITIDWSRSNSQAGDWCFMYGMGGALGNPIPWKTIAVDPAVIPLGSSVEIEIYKSRGPFKATDTGGAIKGNRIDVFVGAVPLSEAFALGVKQSVVRILSPEDNRPIRVMYNSQVLNCPVRMENGRSYVPLRQLSEALGHSVGWDGRVLIDGRYVTFPYRNDNGTTWAWVRDLASFLGLNVGWDESNRLISLSGMRSSMGAELSQSS